MVRPLIDPRMLGRLTNGFPTTVTIQQPTEAQNSTGEPIATWADLADHADLACTIVPAGPPGGKETRRADQTYVRTSHAIGLQGHYLTITEKMRAVSGGLNYDILLVDHDSQAVMTWLHCERVF